MNPILTLTRNCLPLTQKAVDSFLRQDVPVSIFAIDNGSTDGTLPWLEITGLLMDASDMNSGVSAGWNYGLYRLFDKFHATHVLVSNNDVVLAPWTYRELLSYDVPFVTGISVDTPEVAFTEPGRMPLTDGPDFSCFLIRRDAWQTVGPFDEDMRLYASDLDWHIRAHRKGVRLLKANIPFLHYRSSTLNLASPADQQSISLQADRDRAVLKAKWGCDAWSPEYAAMFSPETFGVDR